MFPLALRDVQLLIASLILLVGFVCILIGVLLLVGRGYSKEVRAIATHAARIGQKGIVEEMSSLVTSASSLLTAVNGLVRTSNGIAVFLIFIGMAMVIASYVIFLQVDWAAL